MWFDECDETCESLAWNLNRFYSFWNEYLKAKLIDCTQIEEFNTDFVKAMQFLRPYPRVPLRPIAYWQKINPDEII